MASKPVRSRLVLYFPGFEASNSKSQLGRLQYNAEKSAKVWNFSHICLPAEGGEEGNHAVSICETRGEDWRVDTRVVLFDWSDISSSYLNTPYPGNLFKYLPSFLSFFVDGTNLRYFKTSKRYWAFSLFPLVFILSFILVSWLTANAALAVLAPDVSGWALTLMQIVLSTLLATFLCKWPGDRLYINLTINMSGFIRTMANGGSPDMDERVGKFAKIMEKEIDAEKYDEILVAAHSIGVMWGVLTLSKVLKANPAMLKSTNATFLAFGSNLPRTALAPRAGYLRDHLQYVMNCSDLFWHEFMSKDDIVSFYKADTIKVLGVVNAKAQYVIDRVRFKTGMQLERYRQMRKSFYRTHKQYVMYYDKPVYFDFVFRCFGPILSKDLAQRHELIDNYS